MLRQPSHFRQKMCCNDYEIQHNLDTDLHGITPHCHDFYELLYLLSGDVTCEVENHIYHTMPGDLLLIAPQELHAIWIRPDMSPYERYVLWLAPAFAASLSSKASALMSIFTLDSWHTRLLRLPTGARHKIRDCMEAILQESKFDSDSFGGDLMAPALVTQLLVSLGRITPEQRMDLELDRPSAATILASNIADYLNLHYTDQLSLDRLAEQFLVSKYHLSHTFSQQTGTSVYHYIQKKRVQFARQLLSKGIRSSDVCAQCGFSSYACFFRSFKAEYGVSPREYASTVFQQTT